jgi:hypothetical protein
VDPEGPTDALYDFLYRDSSRVASYYAQLFGGRLSSSERTDQDRKNVDLGIKGSVLGFGGERVVRQETQTSSKEVVDPHDLIITDVLAKLKDRWNNDPLSATHGSLVLARGTVTFIDRTMLQMAVSAMEQGVEAEKKKPGKQRDQAVISGFAAIKSFMQNIPLPSAFSLRTEGQLNVAGTLKDAGMEEPISAHYFKHGMAGLSDVYLVGIKEMPTPSTFTHASPFLLGASQAAEALSVMLFPSDAIRVTPLAMFRQI